MSCTAGPQLGTCAVGGSGGQEFVISFMSTMKYCIIKLGMLFTASIQYNAALHHVFSHTAAP